MCGFGSKDPFDKRPNDKRPKDKRPMVQKTHRDKRPNDKRPNFTKDPILVRIQKITFLHTDYYHH